MTRVSMRELGKRYVSMNTRRKVALTRVSLRSLTASWRPLPNLLLIGTQRGGTSSLFKYLSAHPACKASIRKEIRFFTEYYDQGVNWYRGHFAMGRVGEAAFRKLAFDATPDYLLDPRVPRRAAALLPDAKILVLLRDPAERALSHYYHNRRLGTETRSFEDALRSEAKTIGPDLLRLQEEPDTPIGRGLLRYSYVERGRYALQLSRWLDYYDRDRVLVLRSEDFFTNTRREYQRIVSFMGLKEWYPKEFRNYSYSTHRTPPKEEVPLEARRIIEEKLVDDQERLDRLMADLATC